MDMAVAEETVRRCISGVLDALVARETDRNSTYRLAAEFASSIPVSFQLSVGQVRVILWLRLSLMDRLFWRSNAVVHTMCAFACSVCSGSTLRVRRAVLGGTGCKAFLQLSLLARCRVGVAESVETLGPEPMLGY